MKIAVYWGCCIQANQFAYEISLRATLPKLGIELVDLSESVCCGDPVKSVNDFAADFLAVRVLAQANLTGLDNLLVPCNRCHFTLSEAQDNMKKKPQSAQKIINLLKEEGLEYNPNIKIWHTINLLHDHVGLEKIMKAAKKPFRGLKVATHVGCQLIRYGDLGRADDAENPRKLDELIEAIGAEAVDYAEKLDCCGAALMRSHPDSALSLAGSKLKAVQGLNVAGLVVSCPDCGLMFDVKQKDAGTIVGAKFDVPVVYYTQLLGLAMGIDSKKLGLQLNQSPAEKLLAKIST
ncbi:MAG TPA: CoB--CoM heterodisulfide reductase iron-sulfur subunit B family protein [Candidatus Acidoferrales bacterium]|nr:CoB--CoM heterodisulfide reductase iron-sulfur subunit B family protein [Candidatus Acidoferrales bacterium]